MKTFKDLEFRQWKFGDALAQGAAMRFENGYEISVQNSANHYCGPTSYEVLVTSPDEMTRLRGYVSRQQVSAMMRYLQRLETK